MGAEGGGDGDHGSLRPSAAMTVASELTARSL